jgi:phage virion morphogenesis protein
MTYRIQLRGADGVVRSLNLTRELIAGAGLNRLLEGVGNVATRSIRQGIRDQRSPDGTPYKKTSRFGRPAKRLQDTNRLLNSITYKVGVGRVTVGTNVAYAAMQHFGGTQRPKNGKALAIPLTRAVARAMAGRGLRSAFPDAFVFRSSAQGVFLVRKNPTAGKRSKNQLDFLAKLVASVEIEGTHFNELSRQGENDVLTYIERMIQRTAEGGKA